MTQRKEIRVFISSPGDCDAERDAVSRVLDELNRTAGDHERIFFQAVRWEDMAPGLGSDPQAVIDGQLGDYNVLVGIMWIRFGTPIPGGAGSGTEHEAQQAIATWTRIGEPRVMFYFKQDPPKDLSGIDPAQLAKVQNFKSNLQAQGLIQSFHGTPDFESKLRIHLHKLVKHFAEPAAKPQPVTNALTAEPYDGFHATFREVIAAQRIPETGAFLHIVFGSLADIHETAPVIPVGQAFDFWQRGPRSVLASFEKIHVDNRPFFEEIESLWPPERRPRAAGLGHTKYLPLARNSHNLPGVFFVVTTRDLSTAQHHYGLYADTPIEGIDYIIDQVIQTANAHGLPSLAMPLLGTGYANIRRTMDHARLSRLLRRAVTFLSIQKLQDNLRLTGSSLRRAVIVIWSSDPQGQEEHELWDSVTRFLGRQTAQRSAQIEELLNAINGVCR